MKETRDKYGRVDDNPDRGERVDDGVSATGTTVRDCTKLLTKLSAMVCGVLPEFSSPAAVRRHDIKSKDGSTHLKALMARAGSITAWARAGPGGLPRPPQSLPEHLRLLSTTQEQARGSGRA